MTLLLSAPSLAVPVYLPGDEAALPPLFSQIASAQGSASSGVNVVSLKNRKRFAVAGEWFDPGDRVSLGENRALEVIHQESVKWIGGGAFQGQILKSVWAEDDRTYDVALSRGWMKVWIKPGKLKPRIRITTPEEQIDATDGEFWLGAHKGKTELYVIRGEVKLKSSEVPYGRQTYIVKLKDGGKAGSREWNAEAMEVRLSSAFPALGQLLSRSQQDWETGKSSLIYASFRRKGWRKHHRFDGLDPK
jgi:hypothetical protein